MKSKAIILLTVLAAILLLSSSLAFGQVKKKVKEKFYNFDDMLIDGEYKKPNAILFTARDKVRFNRLLNLRKSFMPVLVKTSRSKMLK